MLVTALPSEAQAHLHPLWLASLDSRDPNTPILIWHDSDDDMSHINHVTARYPWQWLARSSLWHQDKVDERTQHWPQSAQYAYRHSLQAIGLLHDTLISTSVPSETLIWVGPEWLIELGSNESAWQWLMSMASTIDEAAFGLANGSAVHGKPPTGRGGDVIWVKTEFLPRLNAMYWHVYDEAIQRGEHPIASQLLKQLAATKPGRMHWLSSVHPGQATESFWYSYQGLLDV